MSTLRPKLQAIMKKYKSTAINPIQLIQKYQESLKSTTLPPNISRKYPTKYLVGKTKSSSHKNKPVSDGNIYNQYTTPSSFRYKDDSTKTSSTDLIFDFEYPTRKKMKFKPTFSSLKTKNNDNLKQKKMSNPWQYIKQDKYFPPPSYQEE